MKICLIYLNKLVGVVGSSDVPILDFECINKISPKIKKWKSLLF